MKLVKISYKLFDWELENLELDDVNLLVGKNATGKSRTISIIDLFVRIITQQKSIDWSLYGDWKLEFKNAKKEIISYDFSIGRKNDDNLVEKSVVFERLVINGEVLLERKNEKEVVLLGVKIHPPTDKLVLHVQRDVEKYPFFEEIIRWAELSFGFKFANLNPYEYFLDENHNNAFALMKIESIPVLFYKIQNVKKQRIIDICANVGYSIEDIFIDKIAQNYSLYIKEKGVQERLTFYELSQGMFRTLSVIIYIEYLLYTKQPATIIIDDLCEGLDYDRATKLGKWVFETCKGSNVQLIATSNDSFLMDVVDINYWNVLQREGSKVTAISAKTHPELFEKFKFTGLSNFDFFASDYIHRKLSKTPKND